MSYEKVSKYIILGAGPSGLAFAATLKRNGEDDFIIIDKEDSVGGLCRSIEVDGSPLDIGGGHFLDVNNKKVTDFLFSFHCKKEWNKFSRISKIETKYGVIDYPYESNIWQFPVDIQVEYLESISRSGSITNKSEPKVFSNWIQWKLGDKIANDYMLPYNKKIFSTDLDSLGTYWLHKLPNVSFKDVLRSCLDRKAFGSIPAHASFYYPKNGGYGVVWEKIGDYLKDNLFLNTSLQSLDINKLVVNNKFKAKYIINTIPWREVSKVSKISSDIDREIKTLTYSGIDVDYIANNEQSNAHWVYVPDENTTYHRKLIRSNFMENASGYWTETNSKRSIHNKENAKRFSNKYAYPINTINKPKSIRMILDYFSCNNIYGLGRWGKWEHTNSDVATSEAIDLASHFINKK